MPTHTGHLGGLERNPPQHGEFAVYYSSHSIELIYHVASLMPNSDLVCFFLFCFVFVFFSFFFYLFLSHPFPQPEQPHKLRLIGANRVAIVWHEGNVDEYVPDFGNSGMLQIVISPIFEGCLSK